MSHSYADIIRLADNNTKSTAQQVRKKKDVIQQKICFGLFSA